MGSPEYQRIKGTCALPTPSGVALELLRLVDDEESSIGQIIATVESDPAIASRLLKLVNSSLTGVSRTIASVATAAKLLGRHTVKNLALGASLLADNREGASKAFDYERFWSESLARAVAARRMAGLFGSTAPDEAFTVALLSQIGRLGLATADPESYDRVLKRAESGDVSRLLEAERKAFDIDHNDLAAEMMADWHLADVFCEAVRSQDAVAQSVAESDSRVGQIARLLHLSGELAAVLAEPRAYREDLTNLCRTAEGLGVDWETLADTYESVEQEWKDVGAIFSVPTQEPASLREFHTRASQEHRKILAVDDDPDALELLEKHLAQAGYDVLTASNGVEALRVIHAEGCQIVVTDWMMPELDGFQLCRAIRESEGAGFVYIVMLTAHSDAGRLAEAFEAGADDFLSKPYRREELLARLKAGTRILELQSNLGSQQRAAHKANAKLATLNDKLHQMATTDELTGLYNRREAMRRLEEYWSTSERDAGALSCMLMDIDHFKRCNDTYGHDVGDAVLRKTAQVLTHCARGGEAVYRIGGEEFLILCPGSTAEMAAVGAERLRAAIEANRIEHENKTIAITISVGVAQREDHVARSNDLLKLADEALYEAKRSGRNRVCTAGNGLHAEPEHFPKKGARSCQTATLNELNGVRTLHGRVLVVDDDPSARLLLRRLLEREGFEVHEACDGLDALAKVSDVDPDVILMDALMPKMDGFACARALKADPAFRGIPIVMVSGQTDEKHVQAGLEAGAEEYVAKPIRHRELLRRIRTMIQLHSSNVDLLQSNQVRCEQARAMGILFDLSRRLAVTESIEEIVEHTVSATAELTSSRRVSVMLPDDDGEYLYIANAIGITAEIAEKIRVPVGGAIAGRVFASGDPIVLNTTHDESEYAKRYDSEFFASVPLASHTFAVPNKILGVLNVTDRQDGQPFVAHELEYLDVVCNMTASALEQVRAGRARKQAHAAIVTGLAKLAEHRDMQTGNHLERVIRYAVMLAEKLRQSGRYRSEIDKQFIEDLNQAMPLHDIGKVAVPDAILLKPGRLTHDEFEAMKLHAEAGVRAIQFVIDQTPDAGFLIMARKIAHSHHEWFDGAGYPCGLSGEEIPLAARIAAVADVYDALTTKRPYKEAFPHTKAVEIIREGAGTHFDPDVVEAFLFLEEEFAETTAELSDPDQPHDDGRARGESMRLEEKISG